MHRHCRHYDMGQGMRYCGRTQCVYIQTDLIPTERTRKIRGSEFEFFARKAESLAKSLKDIPVRGWIMLAKGQPLPAGGAMDGDLIELRRDLEASRLFKGEMA